MVTHLPQVAAFADTHLVVEKSDTGAVVGSGIVRLDDDGRLRELSRMLAGLEDSEFGRAHAASCSRRRPPSEPGCRRPPGAAGLTSLVGPDHMQAVTCDGAISGKLAIR